MYNAKEKYYYSHPTLCSNPTKPGDQPNFG
jgi:hypothetical protein